MWRFSGLACEMILVRPTGPGGVSDFFFNGPPNSPGGIRFSMVRPTGLRGRGRVWFQWSAQRARQGFRIFFFQWSAQRVCGVGVGFFQWSAQRVCGVGVGFFQWFAQRAREGFRIFFFNGPPNGPGRSFGFFFSMVRPTGPGGVSFFNGPPNGPGRGFVFQWFAQRVCGVGVGFFQWFAQRALGGVSDFLFQWSAQRAREGFRFSMVRPTGLRGRGRFFSTVRPTGPGGVSDLFFQWSAQRAREEFRIFFFNGPPNGPGRGFVFQWFAQRVWRGFGFFLSTGLPNVPGGFRFSMVCPTRLVCRGPQTLKGHLHGFGPHNAITPVSILI